MDDEIDGRDPGEETREAPPLIALVDRLHFLIRSRLWAQIVAGMLLGVGVGLLLSPSGAALVEARTAEVIASWLALPGHVFLALIQMIVIALVTSSIVVGITSSGEPGELKRIGLRIAPYFLATTTVAVVLGVLVASTIEPGRYLSEALVRDALAAAAGEEEPGPIAEMPTGTSLPERIVEIIPTNPLDSALNESMLQVVVFAILMGIALLAIPRERARPVLDLAGSVQEISMKVVSWAMVIAPLAVFGLLAQITTKVGLEALIGMSVYVGTVLLGLAALLTVYVVIVRVVAGRPALGFLAKIREVQLLAFSTSSSAAVMPLSMKTAEEKLGVSPSIAKFVVPLGATVNMDGTALYQVVAALFLTQVFGIDLPFGSLVLLTATTIGASIGAPSAPGVGIVVLASVLHGFGVPAAGVVLVIGVDRILDMARTAINVSGDLTACLVLDRWLAGAEVGALPSTAPEAPA